MVAASSEEGVGDLGILKKLPFKVLVVSNVQYHQMYQTCTRSSLRGSRTVGNFQCQVLTWQPKRPGSLHRSRQLNYRSCPTNNKCRLLHIRGTQSPHESPKMSGLRVSQRLDSQIHSVFGPNGYVNTIIAHLQTQ